MADIGGRPMLRRVLDRCALARSPHTVVLCTDSEELMALATEWGFPAMATSPACSSGSERIASVVEAIVALAEAPANETVILNVQGDQPFIDPQTIDKMALEFEKRGPATEVLTPVYRMAAENVHNPNVVKTLVSADGRALYFSRSAIPHVRDVDPADWASHAPYWGHVGIYGYRADVLARWPHLPSSPLESFEKLEQLRLLEAGLGIGTFQVEAESLSVDTPEQLEQARSLAAQENGGG